MLAGQMLKVLGDFHVYSKFLPAPLRSSWHCASGYRNPEERRSYSGLRSFSRQMDLEPQITVCGERRSSRKHDSLVPAGCRQSESHMAGQAGQWKDEQWQLLGKM